MRLRINHIGFLDANLLLVYGYICPLQSYAFAFFG